MPSRMLVRPPFRQAKRHKKFHRSVQQLCASNLVMWIVPVGELEGFCKSDRWSRPEVGYRQMLSKNETLANDPELGAL